MRADDPNHFRRGAGDGAAFIYPPAGRSGSAVPRVSARVAQKWPDMSFQPGRARFTALFQLASELPAALLARMLGIHIDVAVTWQRLSAGDWMAYAADISRRDQR